MSSSLGKLWKLDPTVQPQLWVSDPRPFWPSCLIRSLFPSIPPFSPYMGSPLSRILSNFWFLFWCLNNIPAYNIWIRFHPAASENPMELQCVHQDPTQIWGCTGSHHCLGSETPFLQNELILRIVTQSLGIRPRRKLVYFCWFMILEYKADFDISVGQGWKWRWLFTLQQSCHFKINS